MTTEVLPVLYKRDSHGKVRYWQVECGKGNTGDAHGTYVTRSGMEGGKETVLCKRIAPVKNQTTEEAVAFKMQSEWNKKRISGAMLLKQELDLAPEMFPISPTLATKYDPQKHWVDCAGYIAQYKYDGVFCIASWRDGSVVLYSRGREPWEFCDHVREQLRILFSLMKNPEDYHLVGELYIHGVELEKLISIVRGKDGVVHPDNPKIRFVAYDLIDPDAKYRYEERAIMLESMFRMRPQPNIVLAPTIGHPTDHQQAAALLEKAEADGYEGLVLRHPDMIYHRRIKYRNPLLLKYKSFGDEEVEIVSAVCGKNAHDRCILFVVKLLSDEDKPPFTVTPKGTLNERRKMWDQYNEDPSTFVGKLYTIRYTEKNSFGLPKFAVGICFRPKKDTDA